MHPTNHPDSHNAAREQAAGVSPLGADSLAYRCDLAWVAPSAELEPLKELLGQGRASRALQFGIGMKHDGYNLFVMGRPGSGRHSLVTEYLHQHLSTNNIPNDWCYVHNFAKPHQPNAIRLPAGEGRQFRHDVQQLIDELHHAIPAAFESDEHQRRAQEIDEAFKKKQEQAFSEIHDEAEREQIKLLRTPGGFTFVPYRHREALSEEEFEQLPAEEKTRITTLINSLHERLKKTLKIIPAWAKETRDSLKALNRETVLNAIGNPIDELRQRYHYSSQIQSHLEAMQQDILEHVDDFRRTEEPAPALLALAGENTPSFRRYAINVLIDHADTQTQPIIYEDQPTYANIIGRVEHLSQLGTLTTDFTLIKAGALHRANGGYLLLDAPKLLVQPYAWDALKRALRSREVHIDSIGQQLGVISTVSLEPEPIPIDLKVILIGDRTLYYLLYEYDPDFRELFKVASDFEDELERTPENIGLYARFIAALADQERLHPLDREAVARVVEYSMRLAGDTTHLSTHTRSIADLLREADYLAREAGQAEISSSHIQMAIDAQIARQDRLRNNLQEDVQRGIVLIDTDGAKVGQVNGLSIIQTGDFSFAHPTRITATARMGDGHVIDIEREVELGGPVHSKGVLILSAFLGEHYAKKRPLSLNASIVFEQTYGGVEGDSASLAELCALLSALAEIPVDQSLAVTGSVNQHGDVQAIGGVNEKIEGFFDVCKARGLSGHQGVIIPAANLAHLMLRHDVIDSCAAGQFHIYAVRSVNEAVGLLTGLPAGERNIDGSYSEASFNALVEARIEELTLLKQSYSELGKDKDQP